jgi:hypothetical protein
MQRVWGANIRAYGGRILLGFQSIKIKKFPEYFFGSKDFIGYYRGSYF